MANAATSTLEGIGHDPSSRREDGSKAPYHHKKLIKLWLPPPKPPSLSGGRRIFAIEVLQI